jgi:hypothetical protein
VHFALRRPLPFVGARYGKRGLHRLDQRRWQRRERCALLSHCWPFLMDRVVDVLGHEGANPRPLLGGRSSASRLTVRRALASLATATFAFSKSLHTCAAMKPTSKTEDDAERRQHAGREGLEGFRALADGKPHDGPIDQRGEKIGAGKDDDCLHTTGRLSSQWLMVRSRRP